MAIFRIERCTWLSLALALFFFIKFKLFKAGRFLSQLVSYQSFSAQTCDCSDLFRWRIVQLRRSLLTQQVRLISRWSNFFRTDSNRCRRMIHRSRIFLRTNRCDICRWIDGDSISSGHTSCSAVSIHSLLTKSNEKTTARQWSAVHRKRNAEENNMLINRQLSTSRHISIRAVGQSLRNVTLIDSTVHINQKVVWDRASERKKLVIRVLERLANSHHSPYTCRSWEREREREKLNIISLLILCILDQSVVVLSFFRSLLFSSFTFWT